MVWWVGWVGVTFACRLSRVAFGFGFLASLGVRLNIHGLKTLLGKKRKKKCLHAGHGAFSIPVDTPNVRNPMVSQIHSLTHSTSDTGWSSVPEPAADGNDECDGGPNRAPNTSFASPPKPSQGPWPPVEPPTPPHVPSPYPRAVR